MLMKTKIKLIVLQQKNCTQHEFTLKKGRDKCMTLKQRKKTKINQLNM